VTTIPEVNSEWMGLFSLQIFLVCEIFISAITFKVDVLRAERRVQACESARNKEFLR
jgi:hypothetical protein